MELLSLLAAQPGLAAGAPFASPRRPAWVGGLILLALAGCQVGGPHATSQPALPQTGSAELILYIADQPFVTAEPACRAVYALAKGASFEGEYAALTTALRDERLIAPQWRLDADQYLDRATVAYMVCRACGIKSGVNWLLTGLGRYAWRELQYKGIAGGGSEAALMSGGEFIGLLSRAEEYLQRTGRAGEEAVKLGPAKQPG